MDSYIQKVVDDSIRGSEAALAYKDLTILAAKDGRLRKAVEWSFTGYVAPVDPEVRSFVMENLVTFMRHMGEVTVPHWMVQVGLNVYVKKMIEEAQKILQKEREKNELRVVDPGLPKKRKAEQPLIMDLDM